MSTDKQDDSLELQKKHVTDYTRSRPHYRGGLTILTSFTILEVKRCHPICPYVFVGWSNVRGGI